MVKPILIPSVCVIVQSYCHTKSEDIFRKVVIRQLNCGVAQPKLPCIVDNLWLLSADSHSPPVDATCGNSGGSHCDLNVSFTNKSYVKNAKLRKPIAS